MSKTITFEEYLKLCRPPTKDWKLQPFQKKFLEMKKESVCRIPFFLRMAPFPVIMNCCT